MKRAKVLAMVVGSCAMLGLSLSPVPALADPIIDFNVASGSGSITYGGGADDANGTGLSVNSVKGTDTPANAGVSVPCLGCTMTFDTGARIAGWTWGSTGANSILITGHVDLDSDSVVDAGEPTGTLLTGSFGTAFVTVNGPTLKFAGASFLDTKNANLTAFYGLLGGPYPYSGNFGINFFAPGVVVGNAITSTSVAGGIVSNTPVPEASSLVLLGAGLLSLAFWGRKKFNGVN